MLMAGDSEDVAPAEFSHVRGWPRSPASARPMTMASDYLASSEGALSRADHFGDLERSRLWVAEAQVSALQAIAAALDRLAVAVEATAAE